MDGLRNRVLTASIFAGDRKLSLEGYQYYLNYAELSESRDPNRCALIIYNLGEHNRAMISAEHQGIEVSGGYINNRGLLFSGQSIKVYHDPPAAGDPRWKTTIEAADGVKSFRTSWSSRSWLSGTPIKKVVSDLAGDMGLTCICTVSGKLPAAWACYGKTVDALDELCSGFAARWSIQQGVVSVRHEDETADVDKSIAVIMSAATGMIGSPTLTDREKKRGKHRFGVSIKSWMNYALRPGGLIDVRTNTRTAGTARTERGRVYQVPNIAGLYYVAKVRHYGGLASADFFSESETRAFYA